MAHACKYQEEEDELIRTLNVYVVVLAATYLYHMPTEQLVKASESDSEFTREMAQAMLLEDSMSPNWLKEPSGKDFTAIML
jgi:lipid II:glycine glycyltransferase (peptidoglycan interpeptide bridge formation enzyme)